MNQNPYAAPTTQIKGGSLSAGRFLLLAAVGSAIAWVVLLPLFSINPTGAARSVAEWIADIPLPGDMPDPRGPRYQHWNPWL